MNNFTKGLGGASLLVLTVAAQPALAAGTAANADITNTVTVDYQVGGVNQTQKSASDTIKVDRKINVTVADRNAAYQSVSPGQTFAVTAFRITNTSNAALDFALAVSHQPNGAGPYPGNDNFNATFRTPTIYRDVNDNGTYESATDTPLTFIDELAADGIVPILVLSDIPAGQVTGDISAVIVRATAAESGTAGTQGPNVVQTPVGTPNGKNTMETVFADAAGYTGDAIYDGSHSSRAGYIVSAAAITVAKTSTLISDPISVAGNNPGYVPKMIPGAIIEYCLAVNNASGGSAATTVRVRDTVPATMTLSVASLTFGKSTSGAPCTFASASGTNATADPLVDVSFPTIAAGDYYFVKFQVTIK